MEYKGVRLNPKPKLRLKHRRPVWSGYGSMSLPPRSSRKPRNDNFQVTPAILREIERYASRGLNRDQIAYLLDISPDTLERREKADPKVKEQVAEAIKKGQAGGVQLLSHALFESALNGNVTAQIFGLKNRSPGQWRDVYGQEVTGKDGGPIETTVKREYNDQERAARIASILASIEKRSGASTLKLKRRKG